MEVRKVKPILSVTLEPHLYKRLKEEIRHREVSKFVERAIAKELGEHEEKLTTEQKEFEKKLIAGYKRSARSKAIQKENEI